jgi:hypothetical protein
MAKERIKLASRSYNQLGVGGLLSWTIVGLGLLLAGCGAGAAAANVATGEKIDAAASGVVYQDASGVSVAPPEDTVVSPVADFIDGPGNDRTVLAEIHDGTATCMQDLGWDYVAPDVSKLDGLEPPSTFGALQQWTETYGYGITTQTGQPNPTREAIDAQYDYEAQLSQAARVRYQSDLYGPEGTDENAPIGADRPGCAPQAERAAYEDVPAANRALLDVLGERLQGLWSSDEYVSALDGWRSCMAAQGFDFARQGDAKEAVLDRFGATDLNELQMYERSVALADLACAESTLSLVAVPGEAEIVADLVARFPDFAASAGR